MSVALGRLLKGKVALITGAAGGIGAATARLLAEHGARVALTDLDDESLTDLAEELTGPEGRPLTRAMDVTSYSSVESAVDWIVGAAGGLDLIANVAGGPAGPDSAQPIESLSAQAWQRSLALNLSGPFHVIKATQGPLRERGGGAVVTVGSLASIRMSTHAGAGYTAAKAGVLGLTRHAAFELARENIRVNAVLPGIVDGALMRSAPPSATTQAEATIPLGRMTTNDQIARANLFLLSDLSDGITGEYLVVDGGMQIGSPTSSKVFFEARAGSEAQ